MARGASSKAEVTNKILEVFEGAFLCGGGKELRIPMIEDGEIVQIKVALTAAKVNVEADGAAPKQPVKAETAVSNTPVEKIVEPSQAEKDELADLMERLGL